MTAVHVLGEAPPVRPCACGCGADLDKLGKRRHAKYASGACRARADRARRGRWSREAKKPHSALSRRPRRATTPRVRPTLTREEAMDLLRGRRTKNRERARQKITDALIRSGGTDG